MGGNDSRIVMERDVWRLVRLLQTALFIKFEEQEHWPFHRMYHCVIAMWLNNLEKAWSG